MILILSKLFVNYFNKTDVMFLNIVMVSEIANTHLKEKLEWAIEQLNQRTDSLIKQSCNAFIFISLQPKSHV